MSASQRTKGASGERELVRLLRDQLGDDTITRNLDQVRDGGGDILLQEWVIEVKRCRRASFGTWWRQAVAQAGDRQPALAYRLDRQPWRVRIPLAALVEHAGPVEEFRRTVEISLDGFVALIQGELNTPTDG